MPQLAEPVLHAAISRSVCWRRRALMLLAVIVVSVCFAAVLSYVSGAGGGVGQHIAFLEPAMIMADDENEGAESDPNDMAIDKLPPGLTKEVVTAAPPENYQKPRDGDDVTVHYVGTLQADGKEFDSSRSRGEPFVFTIGKGNVIKGWDLGVKTMRKGEVAKFTIAPPLGYGDHGAPPKIPGNATLIFEVELISWIAKDDLFKDGGVIMSTKKDGEGFKFPRMGDEVVISLKALASDGSVIEERPPFEYVIGSGVLDNLSKVTDKVLCSDMKKGEVKSLKCRSEYAYPGKYPEGVTLELGLQEIYKTKDVSFKKDKSIVKKRMREGEGHLMPKDATNVTLKVQAVTDSAGANFPGFSGEKTLDFTAGNGDVCDALECAVCEMKKGEFAILTCTQAADCCEPALGLAEIKTGPVIFKLELMDFVKCKEQWHMNEDEKLIFGAERKEVGTNLFKRGRIGMALERYKKVAGLFNYVENMPEEKKLKAEALRKACELNKAACQLKLKSFREAVDACNAVLKEEPGNIKALYRRATAYFNLNDNDLARQDIAKLLEYEPDNADAKWLLPQVVRAQKIEDKKSKNMFARMCSGLGTLSADTEMPAANASSVPAEELKDDEPVPADQKITEVKDDEVSK
eukprot:gnl/TRDRNA2_/TRDRNA2_91801_c0_seq1.p1 gnl/TRDRNA2_/TRDRNA2_91801_c0~~gnl/TRDRNA2_/TRDRNA2_91801_c0_seq1.p1  ORF type:complete len:632 (-),score=148.24 gnl/TRDRNA2_/TRDRNA2_91801_c0_seq1:193-2088(-)